MASEIQILHAEFVAADRAWQAEIERCFPKEWPGDVRYTKRAEGEPGSDLRSKHEAFAAARDAWQKAIGIDGRAA